MDIDLGKNDYRFAAYLRGKGYQPSQEMNLNQLRKEFNSWSENNKTVQEYLDTVYPKNQRGAIKELNIGSEGLTETLDLNDFVNLENLDCSYGNKLTSLNLDNCLQLKSIRCSYNQITELKVDRLAELTRLNCENNQLTQLDLSNLKQLKSLSCSSNRLKDLKLPSQTKQLTHLDVRNNNFPEQDLFMLRSLTDLTSLYIGNNDEDKIQQNIYNRFVGSLAPLMDLTKLEHLEISNTDIDSGLRCLASTVQNVQCSTEQRANSKVREIQKKLSPCNDSFVAWKQAQLKTEFEEQLARSQINEQQTQIQQAEMPPNNK